MAATFESIKPSRVTIDSLPAYSDLVFLDQSGKVYLLVEGQLSAKNFIKTVDTTNSKNRSNLYNDGTIFFIARYNSATPENPTIIPGQVVPRPAGLVSIESKKSKMTVDRTPKRRPIRDSMVTDSLPTKRKQTRDIDDEESTPVAQSRTARATARTANYDLADMLGGISFRDDQPPELEDIFGGMSLSSKKQKQKFGKKFIQMAIKQSKRKGTVGSFKKWCKSKGLVDSRNKVTIKCIKAAKKSGNKKLVKRAVFAENIKAYSGSSRFGKKSSRSGKKSSRSGKKSKKSIMSLKQIDKMIKTLKGLR